MYFQNKYRSSEINCRGLQHKNVGRTNLPYTKQLSSFYNYSTIGVVEQPENCEYIGIFESFNETKFIHTKKIAISLTYMEDCFNNRCEDSIEQIKIIAISLAYSARSHVAESFNHNAGNQEVNIEIKGNFTINKSFNQCNGIKFIATTLSDENLYVILNSFAVCTLGANIELPDAEWNIDANSFFDLKGEYRTVSIPPSTVLSVSNLMASDGTTFNFIGKRNRLKYKNDVDETIKCDDIKARVTYNIESDSLRCYDFSEAMDISYIPDCVTVLGMMSIGCMHGRELDLRRFYQLDTIENGAITGECELKLTTLILGNTVTAIGMDLLKEYRNLHNIVLGENIESILGIGDKPVEAQFSKKEEILSILPTLYIPRNSKTQKTLSGYKKVVYIDSVDEALGIINKKKNSKKDVDRLKFIIGQEEDTSDIRLILDETNVDCCLTYYKIIRGLKGFITYPDIALDKSKFLHGQKHTCKLKYESRDCREYMAVSNFITKHFKNSLVPDNSDDVTDIGDVVFFADEDNYILRYAYDLLLIVHMGRIVFETHVTMETDVLLDTDYYNTLGNNAVLNTSSISYITNKHWFNILDIMEIGDKIYIDTEIENCKPSGILCGVPMISRYSSSKAYKAYKFIISEIALSLISKTVFIGKVNRISRYIADYLAFSVCTEELYIIRVATRDYLDASEHMPKSLYGFSVISFELLRKGKEIGDEYFIHNSDKDDIKLLRRNYSI